MPRASLSSLPVSGLFGIAKPSGPTSMSIINDVKALISQSRLFVDADKLNRSEEAKSKADNQGKGNKRRGKRPRDLVKIGQGGTLDPLADGVLVVGVGKGTKKLSEFLDCTKEYRTTCLLGCETDTYDSEGARVRIAPWKHVTADKVRAGLPEYSGQIKQVPPIFSALKMDGMPLYDYARKGIPLPRPIQSREVTVHSLEMVEWLGDNHNFRWPEKSLSESEKSAMEKALKPVEDIDLKDDPMASSADEVPAAFLLKMVVSGGTYVRSIVHDLAHSLGSAGHVVTLTRSRQGKFTLEPTSEEEHGCVPWEIFEKALDNPGEADEDGWTEWEREVIKTLEVVEDTSRK